MRTISIRLAVAALALGLSMAAASAQPNGPTLIATPNFGPAGAPVELVGRGFGLETCRALIYLDTVGGTPFASADVDTNGFFTTNGVIPEDATAGPHTLLAQGLTQGDTACDAPTGEIAQAAFRVLEIVSDMPLLQVPEYESTPGASMFVTGSGFCPTPPCSPVTVLFGGYPGGRDIPVGTNGVFFAKVEIAGGTPIGLVPIIAMQTAADGSVLEAYGEIHLSVRPNIGIERGGEGEGDEDEGGDDNATEKKKLGEERVHQYGQPKVQDGAGARSLPPSAVTDVSPEPNPAEPRFGGRCLGITISPTNINNAFVASELGGIWRSTNGGASWSHVDDIPLTISRDTMYDPQNANIVIATGRYDGTFANNGGIWRSTNGGATWSKPATSNPGCSSEASAWGISIPNDAVEHTNIFVGTDCGVAISDDSGATWTHVDPCTAADAGFCAAGGIIYDVEARVVGGNIQVDVCGNEGFFRSTDGGTTWSAPDPASPTLLGLASPCHLATAPQDPDTVYIAHFSMTTPSGFCQMQLLESTTGGTAGSWVDMQIGAQNCRDGWVVTHPALNGDADLFEVYVGDAQRMRGQTCDINNTPRCQTMVANWPQRDSGAHADPSDIAFDTSAPNGCPLLASNDGGMAMSADCGANWTDANAGLHALDIVGTVAGTVNAGATDLYIATQDNGIYASTDNAATWSRPVGADGYNVEADHNPPARVFYRQCFGCSDNIANPGIVGAAAFNDPPGNIPTFAIITQFGPMSYAQVTNDGGTPALWTVYVTTDEGATWNQMGPATLPGNPGEIRAAGPAANPTFYLRLNVGGNLRIYRLTGPFDNTATLTLRNNGLSIPVSAWNVDPENPNFLYAADVGTDQMMFTIDGGQNWDPDPVLTNLVTQNNIYDFDSASYRNQVSAVQFDLNGDTIIVGTRTAGVVVSVDGGANWVFVPGSLQMPLLRNFFFDESDGAIYAATRGRGLWRILLPEADLSIDKSDNPDPVAGGAANGLLTYTITVTNNGPDTAHEVTVMDTIPPDTLHVGDTAGCVPGPGPLLTCNVGDIADGDDVTFDIMVEVSSCEDTITNTAVVTSLDPDPDNTDNTVDEVTTVVDVTPPEVVFCNAFGGEVDANCEFTVTFTARVTDDCCVNAADVSVLVDLPTANATLGVPTINKQQMGEDRVDISGSVLVSDLTSCPATVRVRVNADDCTGNSADECEALADVIDTIPPDITCPEDITLDRGDKLCNDDVQNWLDSTTATDNCDTDVDIVDDSASNGFACGFPYGTTTTVTWTATDDCGNTDMCSADITINPPPRVQSSTKGSLLIYSKVELRWENIGNTTGPEWVLIQDTFVDLTNDYPGAINVQMYFVNGDPPLPAGGGERAHPGWSWVDVGIALTANQPTYWSAATGEPAGVSPFTILDPGSPPGRPDPERAGQRVLRGYIVAWAVDAFGEEIRWNHLKGDAAIVNYDDGTAAEYTTWAFSTECLAHGAHPLDCTMFDANGVCCTTGGPVGGMLDMDGFQYDYAFALLLLDFYGVDSTALSLPNSSVRVDTDLTLHPASADLRQETDGPVTTKASFTVWNENEVKLTGMDRCITCWDQALLRNYAPPNQFLLPNLHTDKGTARIDGLASQLCDTDYDPGDACTQASGGPNPACDPRDVVSAGAALLGVSIKHLYFAVASDEDTAAMNVVGLGTETASIQADVSGSAPPERPVGSIGQPVEKKDIRATQPARD